MENKEKKVEEAKEKTLLGKMTPEEIDNYIVSKRKERLSTRGKFKNKYSEEEREIITSVVVDYIRMGLSRIQIEQQLAMRWQCCIKTALNYYRVALEDLKKGGDEFRQNVREIMVERLEAVAQEALSRNQLDTAVRAYAELDKISGIQTEEKKITLSDQPIKFEFS